MNADDIELSDVDRSPRGGATSSGYERVDDDNLPASSPGERNQRINRGETVKV